jgi:uncharacterized protein (TIGR02265 family)
MQLEPTFSTTAIEGLKRALGDVLTPALQAKLAALGVDYGKPLRAAYRQEVWDQALLAAMAVLFPELEREAACFAMGTRYIEGFSSTLLGKAIVELGRLVGPERTLKRMQHNQRSTNNYSAVELEKLGPTHFRIRTSILPEFLPAVVIHPEMHYAALTGGIYFGVLKLLGVKNPHITYRDVDPAKGIADYDLTWE